MSENKTERVLARCKKTYPDEDYMQMFCDGELEDCDVKIYFKGRKYEVNRRFANKEYWDIPTKN